MEHNRAEKYCEELIISGVPEIQAKAHIHILESVVDGFAGKEDFKTFKESIKEDFKSFKEEIKKDMQNLETRIDAKFEVLRAEFNSMKTLGWSLFVFLMAVFSAIVVPLWKIAYNL